MHALSRDAKLILKHFKDKNRRQLEYALPAELEALFPNDLQACEKAQNELATLGLVELGRAPPSHIPVNSRVRSAALTLEGARYIAENVL